MRGRCTTGLPVSAVAVAVMFAVLTAACGGDPGGVSRHVRDRKAYALGQEHGELTVGLRDNEAALQDALLDVRARITNIHDRLGAQASADYERGFVDYIKANDDSLARVLF